MTRESSILGAVDEAFSNLHDLDLLFGNVQRQSFGEDVWIFSVTFEHAVMHRDRQTRTVIGAEIHGLLPIRPYQEFHT